MKQHPDMRLDLTGLLCPLPVLKARKALLGMKVGQILKVTATDPMSMIDMPHFCQEQGYELLGAAQDEGVFRFEIKVIHDRIRSR